MANHLDLINYNNTFGDWVTLTDKLVNEVNTFGANNYTKDSGILFLNGGPTSLQTNGSAIFANTVLVQGVGSSAYVQNLLTIGGLLQLTSNSQISYGSNTLTLGAAVPNTAFSYINVNRGALANASIRYNNALNYWDILDVTNSNYYRILTTELLSDSTTSNLSTIAASSNAVYNLSVYSQSAYNQANVAFNLANSDNILAQSAYNQANSANTLAQSAYNQANSANTLAQSAFLIGNSAYYIANTTIQINPTETRISSVGANTITFFNGGKQRFGIDTVGNIIVSQAARATINVNNTLTFDMNVASNFQITLSGTAALTFNNFVTAQGQSGYIVLNNSGGYAITAAANTKVISTFLTTVSTSGTYLLSYFSDGSNVYVTTAGAMA